ncbi:periplasmic heavy metal sensor [Desulfovibrio oxyclinae]|uniref:periplasmic heavy metal sensor n=1 Tax=Desulfovibrio oxyclinae TaxID=63560 RepID=UPI00037570A9|nr:periplasmic heavy metal sensor [Desulfovibrio oxyclinae]
MTKKTLIFSIVAIAMFSMAAMAYAGPGYGRGGGCGGPGMGSGHGYGHGNGFYSQLTPEKQAAVDGIFEKYRAKQIELRDKARAAHIKLEAFANSGNPDEKRIDALVADLTDIREQMWDNRAAMSKEIEAETGLRFDGRGRRGGGFNCAYLEGDMRGGHGTHGYGAGHGMNRW